LENSRKTLSKTPTLSAIQFLQEHTGFREFVEERESLRHTRALRQFPSAIPVFQVAEGTEFHF
jgi:hypothetical protein